MLMCDFLLVVEKRGGGGGEPKVVGQAVMISCVITWPVQNAFRVILVRVHTWHTLTLTACVPKVT